MLVPLSVADIMSTDVETIGPDATVRTAAERLWNSDVGSLVVCEDHRPVGIVTESDFVRAIAKGRPPDETHVADVMTPDPLTIGPEATLEGAAETLAEHDFRRLPVVEDDELVGVVSTTDLSYFLPHFARRERHARPDEHDVSPEMEYEDEEWEFEHEGPDETSVDVGDVLRFRKELSDEDVRAFAEASGDTNRLHLDDEFAERTRFGRRIVHGTLTIGVVSAALARLPGLTIYVGQDVRYLDPVEVGERVTAVCEVVEDLGGDKYRLRTAIYDSEGERAVDGEATVLVDDIPESEERTVVTV